MCWTKKFFFLSVHTTWLEGVSSWTRDHTWPQQWKVLTTEPPGSAPNNYPPRILQATEILFLNQYKTQTTTGNNNNNINNNKHSVQFSSVQSLSCVRLFATPWTAACQASMSITNSQSPPKPMSIEWVMPLNHLIRCCPLLLLPSIFPSIRVFSNGSALCIRWPKYWGFSFKISPFNEHPGLVSFLKPAWTSGSSWFTYCWSLAWRILSITLLACEMSAIVQ